MGFRGFVDFLKGCDLIGDMPEDFQNIYDRLSRYSKRLVKVERIVGLLDAEDEPIDGNGIDKKLFDLEKRLCGVAYDIERANSRLDALPTSLWAPPSLTPRPASLVSDEALTTILQALAAFLGAQVGTKKRAQDIVDPRAIADAFEELQELRRTVDELASRTSLRRGHVADVDGQPGQRKADQNASPAKL